MKIRKRITTVFLLLMAVMVAVPSLAANKQDIGEYDKRITSTYNIYPTERYRYAATDMIDNLEASIESETGYTLTITTGVVNTSNSLVTYEYNIKPQRKTISVRYSAPVGSYFKLRQKCAEPLSGPFVYGTWAPNDK